MSLLGLHCPIDKTWDNHFKIILHYFAAIGNFWACSGAMPGTSGKCLRSIWESSTRFFSLIYVSVKVNVSDQPQLWKADGPVGTCHFQGQQQHKERTQKWSHVQCNFFFCPTWRTAPSMFPNAVLSTTRMQKSINTAIRLTFLSRLLGWHQGTMWTVNSTKSSPQRMTVPLDVVTLDCHFRCARQDKKLQWKNKYTVRKIRVKLQGRDSDSLANIFPFAKGQSTTFSSDIMRFNHEIHTKCMGIP